jgi:hypothetical protein
LTNQVEGFLEKSWEILQKQLKWSRDVLSLEISELDSEQITEFTRPFTILCCGGSKRFNKLSEFLCKINPQNFYILTNNKATHLIFPMMQVLLKGKMIETHVISMWNTSTDKKVSEIQRIQNDFSKI